MLGSLGGLIELLYVYYMSQVGSDQFIRSFTQFKVYTQYMRKGKKKSEGRGARRRGRRRLMDEAYGLWTFRASQERPTRLIFSSGSKISKKSHGKGKKNKG